MLERGAGYNGDMRVKRSQAVACLPLKWKMKHPLRAETQTDTDNAVVVNRLVQLLVTTEYGRDVIPEGHVQYGNRVTIRLTQKSRVQGRMTGSPSKCKKRVDSHRSEGFAVKRILKCAVIACSTVSQIVPQQKIKP